MGYTHYFPQHKDVPLEQWAAFKADVLRLFDSRPSSFETAGYKYDALILCDSDGEVELTEGSKLFEFSQVLGEVLVFNGDDRAGRGLAHETMLLRQKHDPEFQFCKTARKPYDWFVVAVLLLAHKHCPGCWDIGSDGDDEDWAPAINWLEENGFGALNMPFTHQD